MTDSVPIDPAVEKLIEYAKEKKVLTWDELNELLPESILNTDKMDQVLSLLEQNRIQLQEEELPQEDDEESDKKKDPSDPKKFISVGDKDSSVDDPIRLYLREIGRENLLTAEQEVELSKKMEDGENIIKGVIKNSGMIIPEFYAIAQRAFAKIDPHESNKTKKELNEEMAEKRRLKHLYGETIKEVLPDMKQYIALKKKLFEREQTVEILSDSELSAFRNNILPVLSV